MNTKWKFPNRNDASIFSKFIKKALVERYIFLKFYIPLSFLTENQGFLDKMSTFQRNFPIFKFDSYLQFSICQVQF